MRPERDELDRFKSRKDAQKVKPAKKSPSATTSSGTASKPVFLTFLVVILVFASGALGWGYMQQEARVSELKAELDDAIGFISQSKLLIARLEGELNQTGEELEQSGSAAAQKLKFLDSEMRKLWGVSNDRNKKAIQSNADALVGLEAKLLGQQKTVGGKVASLEQGQASFEKLMLDVQTSIKAVRSQVSLASGEMAITREAINEDLSLLRDEIEQLSQLADQIKRNQKAIAAIDTSRKQLNERFVALDRKVNEIQLSAGPQTSTP